MNDLLVNIKAEDVENLDLLCETDSDCSNSYSESSACSDSSCNSKNVHNKIDKLKTESKSIKSLFKEDQSSPTKPLARNLRAVGQPAPPGANPLARERGAGQGDGGCERESMSSWVKGDQIAVDGGAC